MRNTYIGPEEPAPALFLREKARDDVAEWWAARVRLPTDVGLEYLPVGAAQRVDGNSESPFIDAEYIMDNSACIGERCSTIRSAKKALVRARLTSRKNPGRNDTRGRSGHSGLVRAGSQQSDGRTWWKVPTGSWKRVKTVQLTR